MQTHRAVSALLLAFLGVVACNSRRDGGAAESSSSRASKEANKVASDSAMPAPAGPKTVHKVVQGGQKGRDNALSSSGGPCKVDSDNYTPIEMPVAGGKQVQLWKDVDGLCFMEYPGSEVKLRGQEKARMWILPESRVNHLTEAILQQGGRVVARVWNDGDATDPIFKAWNLAPMQTAYIWVGPINSTTTILVFNQNADGTTNIITQSTNFFYTSDAATQTLYAQAGWGHPNHQLMNELSAQGKHVFVLDDDGKSTWFNCSTGCCTMSDLYY